MEEAEVVAEDVGAAEEVVLAATEEEAVSETTATEVVMASLKSLAKCTFLRNAATTILYCSDRA